MKEQIKTFIRENLCIEKQIEIGPVSVLLCDLMLSFNLKGPDVIVEEPDGSRTNNGPSTTYGITIEPFVIHLVGRDGDVCWSSPGWSLVNWAFSKRFQQVSNNEPTTSDIYGFQFGT